LTLDPRLLDNPLLIALSSTDAVSLFSTRLGGSITAEAMIFDGKFLVIEQRDIPLINKDVSHVFALNEICINILSRPRYFPRLWRRYRNRRSRQGELRDSDT
jgi:hypothetical protein